MKRRWSTVGRPRKLTEEQISRVLAWHEAHRAVKTSLRRLATEFGVSHSTVYDVIRRRNEFKRAAPVKSDTDRLTSGERISKHDELTKTDPD